VKRINGMLEAASANAGPGSSGSAQFVAAPFSAVIARLRRARCNARWPASPATAD
jgi:hypothetical protein